MGSERVAASSRRSRRWWLWRFVRAYHKHGCLRYRGVRGTWIDAMIGRNMMEPAEQWKLGPIRKHEVSRGR